MSSERTHRVIDRASPHHSLSEPGAPANAPIDAEILSELRSHFDGQESIQFEDLLTLFLRELDPRLDAIRSAIQHADQKEIAAAAHALKGGSALVGARAMTEMCLQIELAGRNGAIADAQVVMTPLEYEAERVRQALTAALGAGAPLKSTQGRPKSV
jgi:HPt (histidine-containing phosphotransfer) domain-containing protein